MADDEMAYLQPDFDPGSLTVPRLRSVLVAHNVQYPSSAKKPDLIGLFNENVAPQARKIRTAQSKTKRSTRGIVDVPSAQGSIAGDVDGDGETEDDVAELETPATARRASRRTTRAQTEETISATPRVSRSARQSTAPLVSPTKNAGAVAVEATSPRKRAPRQTKKSISPALKQEEEEEPVYREGPGSPFSRDNPFQSGSPPAESRSKSRDRRRTTLGPVRDGETTSARESRRRTDGFDRSRQEKTPASRSIEMPVASLRKQREATANEISAGEEFVPEEQAELDQAGGQESAVVVRPRKKAGPKISKAAPLSVLVALLGGIAAVWRQEKIQVGYCGVGQPSTALAGVEIPEWASAIQPQCEPCPQHAYCYGDLKTVCESDFVWTQHPLSLNGLIPLPPTCEPDSEKVRKIKQVADFAVESELRERNAKYECGEVKSAEVAEEDLKAAVSAKRSKRMTDEEFDELWDGALGEIVSRDEVVSKADGQHTSRRLLRSTSLARVSLSCAIRRSLRSTLRQHLPKLVALIALSLGAVYGRHALVTRRSTSTRAKTLAGVALDKLATQASLHATDATAYPEPWVSMVALRDDVLRDEFSARERGRLWDVVKGLVEGNANVRTMVREGRTGEVSRVWEWIGAVYRIESPDAGRRGSARFSLGGPGRLAGGGNSPGGSYLENDGDASGNGTPREMRMEKSHGLDGGGAYY